MLVTSLGSLLPDQLYRTHVIRLSPKQPQGIEPLNLVECEFCQPHPKWRQLICFEMDSTHDIQFFDHPKL